MRRMTLAIFGLLLAFPSALFAQQPPPLPQQDVVAAARKAREAKKSAPKAKLVFTNDNIPTAPGSSATTEAAAVPPDSKGTAAAPVEEKKGLDESAWRRRFDDARSKVATAEKELDIMQRELNLNQQQYYSDPNKTLREEFTRNTINKGRAGIDAKKLEVEQLKRALSDLEDELRKAGGPAGWSRP